MALQLMEVRSKVSTVIKPLRRTGSSGIPNVFNMQEGEIAVNSFDQKIWMRVGDNLVEIANASSGGSASPVTIALTGALTLSSDHLNTMCEKTTNSTFSVTLPASYGAPGDSILFINGGTGNLTISRATGVALYSYGANANLVIPTRRVALLVRSRVANVWYRA